MGITMQEKKEFPQTGLTGSTLKVIAAASMLFDHLGAALIENGIMAYGGAGQMAAASGAGGGIDWYLLDLVLRTMGRIAFPIFCFLLTEGFLHTRSEKRYAGSLLLFAFISEVFFDLAFFNTPFFMGAQNVYFTLFLGVVMMHFLKKYPENPMMQAITVAAACVCAVLIRCDYSCIGILMIAAFYLLRGKRPVQFVTVGLLAAYESIALFGTAALALIPIACYNGQRGRLRIKYLFYWFYPVHIGLLVLIRWLAVI